MVGCSSGKSATRRQGIPYRISVVQYLTYPTQKSVIPTLLFQTVKAGHSIVPKDDFVEWLTRVVEWQKAPT